jgi:hypothetical protein
VDSHFEELWSVVDGPYAKRPFLRAAKQENVIVVKAGSWNLASPKI